MVEVSPACPAPLLPALDGLLAAAEAMLEEVQLEARFCRDRQDTFACLAKRDALSELVNRMRHGRRNPRWARVRPVLETGLS
jgi:hypothetical protein